MVVDQDKYPAGISPVVSLAEDYKSDLDILRRWNPAVITDEDIDKLRSMCIKHGMEDKYIVINKKNFYAIKGFLSNAILRKYEKLSGEILERERELTPEKKPRVIRQEETKGELRDMYA